MILQEKSREYLNRLKTLTSKLVRYLSHIDFLEKFMSAEIVPKWMILSADICMAVSQLRKQRCDNILKDTSLLLINELIAGSKETVHTLTSDIIKCKQEIQNTLNLNQATEVISRCEILTTQESKKLKHTKTKKWNKLHKEYKASDKKSKLVHVIWKSFVVYSM